MITATTTSQTSNIPQRATPTNDEQNKNDNLKQELKILDANLSSYTNENNTNIDLQTHVTTNGETKVENFENKDNVNSIPLKDTGNYIAGTTTHSSNVLIGTITLKELPPDSTMQDSNPIQHVPETEDSNVNTNQILDEQIENDNTNDDMSISTSNTEKNETVEPNFDRKDEVLEMFNHDPSPKTIPRRVKLYTLSADKWIDCGTGYCSGIVEPIPHFYVINEMDPIDVLLDSPVQGKTSYQRQQDTLIVWTNEEGIDYALSFQENVGCAELCEFLCNLQKEHIAPNITLTAVIQHADGETSQILAGPTPELPIPLNNNLTSILDILQFNDYRNQLINQILQNNGQWLVSLVELFETFELNHQLSNIICLNDIIKSLFFFTEVDLIELLIRDDILYSVLGILEYEPELNGFKMNWREFISEKVTMKQVVELNNKEIEEEIRKCFILKFLKDVVLARTLEDPVFNCISTMIQNKEANILIFIQNDESFLSKLFTLYDNFEDDEAEENDKTIVEDNELTEKRRDGIKLIHQYVLISKNQQPIQRTDFYRALLDKGLMKMFQFSTFEKEVESKTLITEVILTLIDNEILLFKNSNEDILLNTLINILVNEKNIGLKTQSFEALKLLINPNNMIDSNSSTLMNDSGNISEFIDESFFNEFYDQLAIKLFQPLISIVDNVKFCEINYELEDLILLEDLSELLAFIAKCHDQLFSRSFILENHLLKGINKLMNKKFKSQIRLSAIRCLRTVILLNDEFYTRYIIENNLFSGFMSVLKETNNLNNLVNSTCLNLLNLILEHVELKNFELLRKYMVEKYSEILGQNLLGVGLLGEAGETGETDETGKPGNADDDAAGNVTTPDVSVADVSAGSNNKNNKNKRALDALDAGEDCGGNSYSEGVTPANPAGMYAGDGAGKKKKT